MDGTLVDSTAVVEQCWSSFARTYSVPLGEILASAHGRLTVETVRDFGPPGIDVQAVSDELAAMELELTDGIVEVPGAAAFVNPLIDAGVIALVTSAPRDLAVLRMQVAGVMVPPIAVCAEDVRNGKPNPEPYLRAAELMSCDPRDAIVFEDAEAGIESARAAGCQVVVVGDVVAQAASGLMRIRDYRDLSTTIRAERHIDGRIRLQFHH